MSDGSRDWEGIAVRLLEPIGMLVVAFFGTCMGIGILSAAVLFAVTGFGAITGFDLIGLVHHLFGNK